MTNTTFGATPTRDAGARADDIAVIEVPDPPHRLRLVGFDAKQRQDYGVLIAMWAIVVVVFAVWWSQPQHVVSWPRFVVSTITMVWTVAIPAWFLWFLGRAAAPARQTPIPTGTVAMVVTKAPSEPWFVVRQTLEGALAQTHPHDTWLADECPDEEVLRWCAAHDVKVCTRRNVAEYQRPDWPRRTGCKEGNLAWFYDTVGYRNYDFVAQLDADHVPDPGYLEAMLQPFVDRRVGYVSAPSVCDLNTATSWSARARAWAEAPLHGALQAGASNGYAPMCIGSHYAVRTAALRDIGGLGPDLAEDHSTSLLMNVGGWRGVHALEASAHGAGPESFSDLMVQEFQWSRSLVTLLLGLTPRVIRSLPLRLRLQFVFSELWYPAFGVVMASSVLLPIVAIHTTTPWMRLPYVVFIAHSLALTALLLIVATWTREQGLFRPREAPVLSWESGLFQILRWPWVLIGSATAVADRMRGGTSSFKVTPKGGAGARDLPLRCVTPHLLIAAASVAAVLLSDDAGPATGYHWFALGNAALYTAGVAVVIALHVRENHRSVGSGAERRRIGFAWTAIVVLAALTAAACVSKGDDIVDALAWQGDEAPPAEIVDLSAGTVNLGIYDFRDDFDRSDRFDIGHHFVNWLDVDADEVAALISPDVALGRWPLLTIEPYPYAGAEATLLADVAAGAYDAPMTEMCRGLDRLDVPVFVRWGHEMEVVSGRYPWAVDDAPAFVAAFRRVADRCRAVLGDDLFMVWSPVGNEGLEEYWPGADYADYIGLSLFDYPAYAAENGYDPDATFDYLFAPKYDRVKDFPGAVMIAEFGTTRTGADKVRWLNDAIASTSKFPKLRNLVFFHGPDTPGVWGPDVPTPDWRIDPETLPNEE